MGALAEGLPLFIKLRSAIFADSGFCLHTDAQLKGGGSTVQFVTLEAKGGKPTKMQHIVEGDGTKQDLVLLEPYPNPEKAQAALLVMTHHLEDALDGDQEAKAAVAVGWRSMIHDGIEFSSLDAKARVDAACNLFGRGRVMEALNRKGAVSLTDEGVDWPKMVDEALHTGR